MSIIEVIVKDKVIIDVIVKGKMFIILDIVTGKKYRKRIASYLSHRIYPPQFTNEAIIKYYKLKDKYNLDSGFKLR